MESGRADYFGFLERPLMLTQRTMNTLKNRRDFLKASARGGLALAGLGLIGAPEVRAIEPIKRTGAARLKPSIVGYSFREYFNSKDAAKKITLFDFIDYSADQGIGAVELTGYYFPKPATNEYLAQIKRHAYLRGVNISGTSTGVNFSQPKGPKLDEQIKAVKDWVDAASFMGAPYVRVFAGKGKDVALADAQQQCIAAMEECAEYAGTKGVFIGLENDQGITMNAEQTLTLIRGVKSKWFGLNLDLGNFHVADPYADVAQCAPYAINVHCKVNIHPTGSKEPEPADYARQFKILRDAGYQGYIAMEYEAIPDPYEAIPGFFKKVKEHLEG